MCYTRALDTWFQQKRSNDQDFWRNEYNVEPPQLFVGTQDGTFRIHPARHANTCGDFDPRSRPWYVSGSSGPKNVVLVLDTSGSMKGIRLDLLKQAAIRVVETLTISDRVGVVHFSSQATVVTTEMLIATAENKQDLVNKINAFEASGATNFFDAFTNAFRMVDDTTESEAHVDCNSAILFLTDGQMTDPDDKTEDDVIDLVSSELTQLQGRLGKPVLFFAYSISENSEVHQFPKKLACSSELGVWSQILDEAEIVQSLTSYYRLFALGLGTDRNTNFVAWAEPFVFYPSGVLGTTASVPFYDRTKDPPQFRGVVGFAFTLSAIDQALEVESNSQATLDRVIRQSTAKCPSINLTLCELETYRGDGRCWDNSTDTCGVIEIEASKCPGTHDYPQDMWDNNNWMDWEYAERTCCKIGENEPSGQCAAPSAISPLVIGGIAAGGVLIVLVILTICWVRRGGKRRARELMDTSVKEMPPPTAPVERPLKDHTLQSLAELVSYPASPLFAQEQIQVSHSQGPQ